MPNYSNSTLARGGSPARSFFVLLSLWILTLSCAPGELKEGLAPDPSEMASVEVVPTKSTAVVGEAVLITASGRTTSGDPTPAEVDWSSDGGTLVQVSDSSATFSASLAGSYRIRGRGRRNSNVQDSTQVTVSTPTSPVTSITVSPKPANLATASITAFTVSARRQDGATFTPTVTWVATGGTISQAGIYTAGGSAGTFRVVATEQGGTLSDTSTVTLSAAPPTLLSVQLSPATASLQTGGTRQFTVSGQWSDGSTAAPVVTYSATGGTVTAGGLYTAGSMAGSFRVIATQQGGTLADTAAITITAPVLQAVILTPSSASLATGGTQQFTVSGQWSNGATTAPAVTYSATGGTVTAGGLYTAGSTAGSYRVIATQQGGTLADTSAITLTVPVLQAVILTPSSASLATGGTQQFTVSGQWSNGATTAPAVTYSATGGTVTAGGLYTAGSTAGSFRVIATQQGGSLADTAQVIVSTPPQGTGYPNEPVGLSTPYTITAAQPNPFDVRPRVWNANDGRPNYTLDSYGWVLEEGDLSLARIATDPERGNVLESRFPAGMTGGYSPYTAMAGGGHIRGLSSTATGAPFAVKRLFLGYYVKLSDNWLDANLGTKLVFFFSSPTDGAFYVNLTDRDRAYLRPGIGLEHSGVGHVDIFGASHGRGAWHRLEWYIQLNTPGTANGILKCWVDGVLEIDRSNVEFVNSVANIDWLKLQMTYGGGSSPVPTGMSVYLDDWYVRVGP